MEEEDPGAGEEKEQLALKMMQKFGYKVGEGLGRQGQGIKTPLIVKKTNDSRGIIQQSSIPLNWLISQEQSTRTALSAHKVEIQRTLVILGVPMDEQLIEDIRKECQSFGSVTGWVAYLLDGSLRIIVTFGSKEEALRGFMTMNGKYLGEQFISVRFLDDDALNKGEYGRQLHSHIPT